MYVSAGSGKGCDLPHFNGPRCDESVWTAPLKTVRDKPNLQETTAHYANRLAARIAELRPELQRPQRRVAELEESQTSPLLGFKRARTDAQRTKVEQRLDALDSEIEDAQQPRKQQSTLIAHRERLVADRDRLLASIEEYDGAFTIEDEAEQVLDEEHSTPGEPVYRPRRPDEPFGPQGRITFYYGVAGDEGAELPLRRHDLSTTMGR